MKQYKKLHDFYIEENEEYLAKEILPAYYIDQNINKNKIDVDYAVRFLQNELNSILNSFINGGFSYKGYIFYPFVKDASSDNINKIKRLRKIAFFLDNNGYDFSNSIKVSGNINSKNFAILLSALHQDFSKLKFKNVKLVKKQMCRKFDINSYKKSDLKYLKPLNGLKDYACKNLKQYLSGFYLHGSFATKDYIKGWSDVDTLSIVSKKTLNNPYALLDLRDEFYYMRNYFYKIDPLQHHGSIVVSEYDMDNYCESYFPIVAFKFANSFLNDNPINFKVRDFSSEALAKLYWFVSYFRKLHAEQKFDFGSYDTKVLLHSITLFPTIYLQAKGILAYKKFSFDIAKKDFKKDAWKVIDNVSRMRSNWKEFGTIPMLNLVSKINPLFYYQLNSRILDLFKNPNKLNKIDAKNLVEDMFELSEEAWSKTKKNAYKKL